MIIWNTSDEVTNANLAYLQSLSKDRQLPFDADRVTNKFIAVIEVMEMLPSAVWKHFDVDLYIGNLAFGWSPERRAEKALELCNALERGLHKVANDPDVQKGGTADLGDRPRSRGEVVLQALSDFKQQFPTGHHFRSLDALRSASYGTSLQRHVTDIDRILSRKRWSGHTSRDYEVYRKIGEIEFDARRYHRQRA